MRIVLLSILLVGCGIQNEAPTPTPTSVDYPIPIESSDMVDEFLEDAVLAYDKYVGKHVLIRADSVESLRKEGEDHFAMFEIGGLRPDHRQLDLKCLTERELWPKSFSPGDTDMAGAPGLLMTGIVRGLEVDLGEEKIYIVLGDCEPKCRSERCLFHDIDELFKEAHD